jgi:RNA polymerase sigma-70 factor (ECF subfamily)
MATNHKKTQINRSLLTAAHHSYQKGMNSHAFFKINDRAASEDLVQDTFIKTWRYLVKGGKIEIMRAFLYHILNDLVIDEYRKRKTTSLDALREKGFEPSIDNSKQLLNFLDGKAAILLIPSLPEKYQKVIRMRYIQDLSLKEISLITGQSKNTIAVQIHRGIEKLKLLYEKGANNGLI